jgi:hypothetical protein
MSGVGNRLNSGLNSAMKRVYSDGNEKQVSGCLFLVVIVLSYIQSISSLNDDAKTNKTLPIVTLIITSLVTLGVLGNLFGGKMFQGLEKYFFIIFIVMLIISFTLAIQDASDDAPDKDKSVPIVTIVIESVLILLMLYAFFAKNLM